MKSITSNKYDVDFQKYLALKPLFHSLFLPFQIEKKWEIPREHLALDKVIGEGEFGKVMSGSLIKSLGKSLAKKKKSSLLQKFSTSF